MSIAEFSPNGTTPSLHHLARLDQVTDAAYLKLGGCAGRLAKAAALVRNGDVTLLPDGYAEVRSQSDATRSYAVNGSCPCDDAKHRADQGRCKHVIAVWMQKRLAQLTATAMPPVPDDVGSTHTTAPVVLHCAACQATVYAPHTCPAAAPTPTLPEAPASVNMKVVIHGREVMVTLRDTDEARLLQRLDVFLQQYPASPPPLPVAAAKPQASSAPPLDQAQEMALPVCPLHSVTMHPQSNAKGRWFSHRAADGTWCKGK